MDWDKLKIDFLNFGEGFLFFAIALVIGIVLVKLLLIPIRKALLKTKLDHTIKTFLFSMTRFSLYTAVVITALSTAGVQLNSVITALGALGLTAGLAFQDTLKNFVSGIIVLFNKPITAGDLIQLDGFEGYVDSIRLFYTKIHTFDNRIVQIPNSKLTSNNIVNCSEAGTRRVDLKFSVSYEDNLTKVKSVIYDVISKNELVIEEPESKVYISKHLDSGVEVTVFVWTKQENYYPVLFGMEEDVKNAFDKNGITIPYPHLQLLNDSSGTADESEKSLKT